MTRKNSYIAAAVLFVTGTLTMAGWAALEADEVAEARATVPTAGAEGGISETEASLPPAPVAQLEVPAVEVELAPRVSNRAPAEHVEPVERDREPEPAERMELVIPANAVLGVRLSTSLSSDTAEVEDRVEATVTRDAIAGGQVAIPAGTKVLGSVNAVTRGGNFKERARLSVQFHTLVLADGTRESVRVDSIVREGESPVRETAAKIGGGAVGGAIVGGIMGGRKGAILGGIAGAGAGTAATAVGDRSVATLAAGSPLSVRLDAPVTIKREQ